ncbi:MAG: ABC transporter ATP-binding protein [Anaerolineales bacterium]
MTEIVLEARNITKRFPGVLANEHVDLQLHRGEILALLGENGAGKSTLMNILYGLYHPDEGEIRVKGQRVQFHDPSDAIAAGIGMVHQHFQLVPVMTVAENVMLGSEITRPGGFLDRRTAHRRVRELSQQHGLEIDPSAVIEELPVGTQQRVEIIKALYRNAEILILDEPTAVLTPQEAEELFTIMRELTGRGVSIIFITHKLKEVLAVADNIAVMRAGRMVGMARPGEATEQSLASMMVGREVLLRVAKGPSQPGRVVLTVRDISARDDRGQLALKEVSFEVRAGEVLGVAGVQGNGQTELVEVLSGLREPVAGTIEIDNESVALGKPRRITEAGAAHVPEDRQRYGLVLPYTVADNLVLNTYYRDPYTRSLMLDRRAIAAHARKLVEEFDVRTASIGTISGSLSGGNQQKVVVAREVGRPIKLLIAAQPTRGLDVGSIEYVHRRIVAQRDSGVAVLLVSAELDEIMSLSDRIAVMYHGRILACLPAAEATREQLGLLMAGIVQ